MRAVHIAKYGRFPVLAQLPIPDLGNNDLLIKMKYAPINPSDLFFYQGKYGVIKHGFPIVGFQGSGVVIKAKNKENLGKKVTVSSNLTNGTHATHILSSTKQVIFWPDDADLKQISMGFVNPLSCIGLCRHIIRSEPKNVLISAGGSRIARMIILYLKKNSKVDKIYAINRSQKNRQQLQKIGAKVILIEDPPSEKLKQLKEKTIFLDCVGGNFAGKTFNTLAPSSELICYGRQSGQDLGSVDLGGLYYQGKSIRGFWLNNWLKQIGVQEIQKAKDQVVRNSQIFSSAIRRQFKIQQFMEAYRVSIKDKSEGKVLLDLE